MMQYLMWRVMKGLHKNITISFLVVGHTKFSPDWCFVLFKSLYRWTCLDDNKDTADKSAKCNVGQLVANSDGTVFVPTYSWKDFLSPHFKVIPSIKKYHHFTFGGDCPGSVSLKMHADTEVQQLFLLKDNWDAGKLVLKVYHPRACRLNTSGIFIIIIYASFVQKTQRISFAQDPEKKVSRIIRWLNCDLNIVN